MKTVLVLLFIFGAAFAAPAEDQKKAPEAPVVKVEDAAAPAAVLKETKASQSRYLTCPSGWFTYQHRCYMFVPSTMNWQDAETHCRGFGAHLAPVSNNGEYAYLQELTRLAGQTDAWLGGFSLQNGWMWTASEGFYYTNWYSQSTDSTHNCMFLRTADGWGNDVCTAKNHFICSKNVFGC